MAASGQQETNGGTVRMSMSVENPATMLAQQPAIGAEREKGPDRGPCRIRCPWWSAFSLRSTLRETVGLSVHFENVDVVGQTVEERTGEALIAECGGPLVERQV